MKRKIEMQIADWIKRHPNQTNSNERKCLLILGQRQVGKTYSIKNILDNQYRFFLPHYVVLDINFESNPEFKEVFDGSIDVETIISKLKLTKKFRSLDISLDQKTIILFFDEIQACPQAIAALKFLALEKRIVTIATGSLLGTALSKVSSFPVGYVDIMHMYPLDFEEFLWHRGYDDSTISTIIKMCKNGKQLTKSLHDELMTQFRHYIISGGMPGIVASNVSIDSLNIARIRKQQCDLVEAYRMDIQKFAGQNEWTRIQECFNSIPRQLAQDNKKFIYRLTNSNARALTHRASIEWLEKSGLVNLCYRLKTLEDPLKAYVQDESFKVYMADTGLLVSMLDDGTADKILSGDLLVYKGALYENVVAQCLISQDLPLYYYQKDSGLELDFVLPLNKAITPLEVKAGDNTKSKSLTTAMESFHLSSGIRVSGKEIGIVGSITYLPLYMLPFIKRVFEE